MIHHTTTDLLNVAYYEQGAENKPVLLLLHGWPDDATTWDAVMPQLMNAGYRVIAPFLRGFGETVFKKDKTERTGNAGIHAFDMIELMDSLNIKKFTVIGHDWGAGIAECLAIGWPKRIERMALLSSPPRLGGAPTPSFDLAQRYWYHWFQATKRGEEAVRANPIGFARIMWENWSPKGWFSEEMFNTVSQSWNNPDFVDVTLHSYRSRWEEAKPDSKSRKLEEKVKTTKTLSLSVLYIQGGDDGVNPPYVSENIHGKFTGPFERIVMPGVGHFPSREAPGELSNYLLSFLRRQ